MTEFRSDPATYADLTRGGSRRAEHHPGASAVGIDENEAMLGAARQRLAGVSLELRVADLTDALPGGPFDLVVSALAIHHLDGPDKADLFARIASVLRPVAASSSVTW